MSCLIVNKSGVLKHALILLTVFAVYYSPVLAQETPKTPLSHIVASINNYTGNLIPEKLYLQTDKPAYAVGDTLWFKVYLFDAAYLTTSEKSGVLYAEITNDSNRVMKRFMLPVYRGLTFGNIALADLPQGGYNLRAYTNWMRNFGERYVFNRPFYVSAATEKDWLINYNAKLSNEAGKDRMQLRLQFNQFDKIPVGLREMQMRVMSGKKTWYKNDVQTSIDGSLDVNFDLPPKANEQRLSLSIQDKRKGEGGREISVPVILNRPGQIDLQFMPEGGNLVAGLASQVAFKAITEDGLSTDVSGKVYDSKGTEITAFNSTHKGMGVFNMLPQVGETYVAKIKLPDGSYKSYPLPKIEASGITLRITEPFNNDSIEVRLSVTADIQQSGSSYYLIGQSRGMALYGASIKFAARTARFMIDKKVFPTGIVRFSVLNQIKQPLNERLLFIDHQDNLHIQLAPHKSIYQQRDSVALSVKVTDKNGAPVEGSFSIAVTDDGQVKNDSLTNPSIISQILMTADLKGNIEDPGYYSPAAADRKIATDRDHLLLTHGWVGYDWKDVFSPTKPPAYPAEQEVMVTGKVTNMFNKPVTNSGVVLLSKKPFIFKDTVTNNLGVFTFRNVPPSDTAVYFIQARNKKNKSFNVGIEMDEFQPPAFATSDRRSVPWYVNIDTAKYGSVNKLVQLKKQQEKITSGNVLKEVVIKGKKIIKGSKNLNGPGEADIIIDEQEMEKAGRKTLRDLMEEHVPGFMIRSTKSGGQYYGINSTFLHIIIDGIDIAFIHPEGIGPKEFYDQFLDYYDAQEIKGIEVMYKGGNQMRYTSHFLDPMATPWDHSFIEVTTRGGKGPFLKKSTGTYLYKPMAYSLPKNFYAPKYTVKNTPDLTDIRSTIHWEPNIVTDKDGKALITFYTADIPGSYTLIIEGTDLNGHIGTQRQKMVVKRQLVN